MSEELKDTELDDDHPLAGLNFQIIGLLEGLGASEDHEDVLAFLHATGLPKGTVARLHRAIVNGDKKPALWAAQVREWPDSVELPLGVMYRWANSAQQVAEAKVRWSNIALALQEPKGFFYITNPERGWVGYRFGTAPSEYMSGYGNGVPFRLNGPVLEGG